MKISKQFKLIIRREFRQAHFRQLQIIFDIFTRHSDHPSIEPKTLKRITDCTRIFEQVVTLSVKGTLFHIPKPFLLRCNSSFFDVLLNSNFFADSNNNVEPLELDIDEENYQIFDKWLRNPSRFVFCDMSVNEILKFMIAVDPFEIPSLMRDCDDALQSFQINQDNVFSLLEQIYQFQKASKLKGMNFLFPNVENKLIELLKSQNLSICPCSPNENANWLLGAETEINITIDSSSSLEDLLSELQNVSIFKDMASNYLNILSLSRISVKQRSSLISCFPNTKTIAIDFKYNYMNSKHNQLINWKFLKSFEKLKKVVIYLPSPLSEFFWKFQKIPYKRRMGNLFRYQSIF